MTSMEQFIEKDGKRLRLGYTTGSCAAAAAKAAAWMLLTGRRKSTVALDTPKGIHLELPVEDIQMGEDTVSCAIRKDGGDDPDITSGSLIYASVTRTDSPVIVIDGGKGVGRVTKRGLDQPVGNAAINSVPRQMIEENLRQVCLLCDYPGGLQVIISVPQGEMLAQKTFNPRLGIVGGISILGTTGIVEPMSEKALVDTIRVELRQKRLLGSTVLLTPGNYGCDFLKDGLGVDPQKAVQVSNFIGDAIDICKELDFQRAILVGHIGKLVKLAGNMMNTHSKYGDCRAEILCALAGCEGAAPEVIREMLDCVSCDEMLRLLAEDKRKGVLGRLTARIQRNLQYRAGEKMTVECMYFSKVYGLLGETENARAFLKEI